MAKIDHGDIGAVGIKTQGHVETVEKFWTTARQKNNEAIVLESQYSTGSKVLWKFDIGCKFLFSEQFQFIFT